MRHAFNPGSSISALLVLVVPSFHSGLFAMPLSLSRHAAIAKASPSKYNDSGAFELLGPCIASQM